MKITGKTSVEIADCIRALVQNDTLRPGDSLPPVRELADTLEVNRNTVAAAYQRLVQAGVAVTQGRLGTTISRPPSTGEQEGLSNGSPLIDLADGNPSPQWLPDPMALLAGASSRAFLYGDDTILPDIQALAQAWFKGDCPGDWTLELTGGAVDAIERLAVAHLVPGDRVAVEDPCFLGTINALRLAGMRTIGVEVDGDGMRPEALRAVLEGGARAVMLTPRAHNPTGCSLTKRRADALKRVIAEFPGVLVIVDDHYALLAETPYHSVIPTSTQRWALVRSVSKGLGPDLRVGLVACDRDTADRLRTRLASGMNWVSHILQAIVAQALHSKDVQKKLAGARDDYAQRRAALRSALLAVGIEVPEPSGGFNLWIPLPPGARDAKEVAYGLARRGWLVRVGSAFDVSAASQALRITVSRLDAATAERFAHDLKSCLD